METSYLMILLFCVAILAVKIMNNKDFKSKKYFCTSCYSQNLPVQVKKGSGVLELALWIFFLPIAIFYSVWRIGNKTTKCSDCGGVNIIDGNSKRAKMEIKKLESID